jgi:hypothetical protein
MIRERQRKEEDQKEAAFHKEWEDMAREQKQQKGFDVTENYHLQMLLPRR